MKILHIIGTTGTGGVQSYLLDLCKYDSQYNFVREVVCLYNNLENEPNSFSKHGIDCFSCTIMPRYKGYRPERIWKIIRKFGQCLFIFKFYSFLKSRKPQIIVCNNPSFLNVQLFISHLLNIPFIWHIHNENQFLRINRILFKLFFKIFFNNKLYIISDSKYILEKNLKKYKRLIGNKYDQIPIIPSTINLEQILSENKNRGLIKNKTITLGSIGRLTWEKNFELLINVFHQVKKNIDKKMVLYIAGDGPMKQRLNKKVKELRLEKNVIFLGNIDKKNIRRLLSKIDIYVQSSVSEGSPIAIKEAMAAGLPVIASKVGGIPELIIHEKTGFLFESENENDFVSLIMRIINEKFDYRKTIGLNAQKYAENFFSIRLIAQKQAMIYQKIQNI